MPALATAWRASCAPIMFLCAITVFLRAESSCFATTYTTVALSGQPAPGVPNNAVFSSFTIPFASDICRAHIDPSGNISFVGVVSGTGIDASNERGLWVGQPTGLRLIAREGDPANGLASLTYGTLSCVQSINNHGTVSFGAKLTGAGVTIDNDVAFWSGTADGIGLLLREGDEGVGTNNAYFAGEDAQRLVNEQGTIAFGTRLRSASGDTGSWKGSPGALQLIAATNKPAPDTNGTFSGVGEPLINGRGDVAFRASMNPNLGVNSGIWRVVDNQMHLVVGDNTTAPGTPSGVLFDRTSVNAITDSGAVIFHATLKGTGVTNSNDNSLYIGEPGALTLIAREGSQAPGLPSGARFGDPIYPASTNGQQIAFRALLTGGGFSGSDMGIWSGTADNLKLRVLTERKIPGTDFDIKAFATNPSINRQGDIAFYAILEGLDVTTENDFSVWVVDSSGHLNLIAREGDEFDVGGGEMRTISTLPDFEGEGANPLGGNTFFNDAGQVVFELSFTDGSSGIFVATVPEFASLAWVLFPIALLARRRLPASGQLWAVLAPRIIAPSIEVSSI